MTLSADPLPIRTRLPLRKSLGDCLASALAGLFGGTFAGSMLVALGMALSRPPGVDDDWWMAPAFAFVLMLPASLFTLPVTLLFGWPAYAWLRSRGWANVWAVLGVVVVAALAALAIEAEFAKVVAMYGACIALCTHGFQRRRDRPG